MAASLAVLTLILGQTAPLAEAQGTFAQTERPTAQSALTVSPETGPAGTTFTVSGQADPAQNVDIQWTTWDGAYSTQTTPETVAYHERVFTEKRVSLGTLTANADGQFAGSFTAPEDFGQLHELHAVVDGQDRARGGFQVLMAATATPSSGPIGTPIRLRVTGLNTNLFSGSTLAVRYDNAYTGLLTAATTAGTAEATIRATGPVGTHSIAVGAGTIPAYLNIHQSPYDFLYAHLPNGEDFQFSFSTTADQGAPETSVEWPAAGEVQALDADAARTTLEPLQSTGASMSLNPASGPILTRTRISATALQPETDTQLVWVTARGNRVSGNGWDLASVTIGQARADANGSLSMDADIPDDLGGWHMLKLVQADKAVAQTPFYVERSLASIAPTRPHAGESVTIHAKGLGWTELDNGFAVTYDNKFIGYACGFNSNGDVTMPLVATGGPGTHLIDLYPMVYNGQDRKAWYWAPVLTFGQDFPALSLGYRIPAFRLAIDVVE